MIPKWQFADLLQLMRRRYPDWVNFHHTGFVAAELQAKRTAVQQFQDSLNRAELQHLMAAKEFATINQRLKTICLASGLLWRADWERGDLAVLFDPRLDPAILSQHLYMLLYGTNPAPERLQVWSNFLSQHHLPNNWSFPTCLLFLSQPATEIIVRSQPMGWFMKFIGQEMKIAGPPTATAYQQIRQATSQLLPLLQPLAAQDMVDVQALLWVCARESRERTGHLSLKGQIDLDVPPTTPLLPAHQRVPLAPTTAVIRETAPEYKPMTAHSSLPKPHLLAEPFNQIFTSREEAEWAFDFLRQSVENLGMTDPDDERFALTMPKHKPCLRLNLGTWLILSFESVAHLDDQVLIALFQNQIFRPDFNFAQKADEPSVKLYGLPMESVRLMSDDLAKLYEATFDYMGQRFAKGRKSLHRRYHLPELAEAIFDHNKRDRLLTYGLTETTLSGPEEPDTPEMGFLNTRPAWADVYPLAQCAADTGLAETEIAQWLKAIRRKGQAILYGPPGTGKTFVAQKLARHLASGGDGLTELVQFHPAYAYEDFVQGIRPVSAGGQLRFALRYGRFYEFCAEASQRTDPCVFIIDEINRANLASVFGELMYLLEYRDQAIPLASGGTFHIPANVYLLGTMNTADRSIALVDHALRRRFAFIPLAPNFDLLRRYHADNGFAVEPLIVVLERLNQLIGDPDILLGGSFFLVPDLANHLPDIWQMEIEPYLAELFFDRLEKLEAFRWAKIKDSIGYS